MLYARYASEHNRLYDDYSCFIMLFTLAFIVVCHTYVIGKTITAFGKFRLFPQCFAGITKFQRNIAEIIEPISAKHCLFLPSNGYHVTYFHQFTINWENQVLSNYLHSI